jgi:hypothetical protein
MGSYEPLDCNWQLPGPRDGLHDNVGLGYSAFEQFGLGSLEQGAYDAVVPPGVDDGDAQAGAIMANGGGAFVVHGELVGR